MSKADGRHRVFQVPSLAMKNYRNALRTEMVRDLRNL